MKSLHNMTNAELVKIIEEKEAKIKEITEQGKALLPEPEPNKFRMGRTCGTLEVMARGYTNEERASSRFEKWTNKPVGEAWITFQSLKGLKLTIRDITIAVSKSGGIYLMFPGRSYVANKGKNAGKKQTYSYIVGANIGDKIASIITDWVRKAKAKILNISDIKKVEVELKDYALLPTWDEKKQDDLGFDIEDPTDVSYSSVVMDPPKTNGSGVFVNGTEVPGGPLNGADKAAQAKELGVFGA